MNMPNPYAGERGLPIHKRGAFSFSDVSIENEPVMDGWAALKILNTPGHPQREMIQRRVHLVTRVVGERYLRLHWAREQAFESQRESNRLLRHDMGGDQYVELTENMDWMHDADMSVGSVNNHSIPDESEIDDAREDALQELNMLKLCKYRVSYWNPVSGWQERWPRIGDMVDVPADLHADIETEEPLESRMSAANHLYDDRWFDNHRPNQLAGHFSPDPLYERITLFDFTETPGMAGQRNAVTFAQIADRKARHMWEVAIWKLAEYGQLQVKESVQRRYGLRPKLVQGMGKRFTPQHLCKFIMWAYHKRFAQSWEFDWIVKSIYVNHMEDEAWTLKRGKVKCYDWDEVPIQFQKLVS